jgi:hypothetical protein
MTADKDWIETSLSTAARANPDADAAVRETLAAFISDIGSQKALSKTELSAAATGLLAAMSLAASKSSGSM